MTFMVWMTGREVFVHIIFQLFYYISEDIILNLFRMNAKVLSKCQIHWEASCRYGENIVSTRRDIEKTIVIADNLLLKIQNLEKLNDKNRENDYDMER